MDQFCILKPFFGRITDIRYWVLGIIRYWEGANFPGPRQQIYADGLNSSNFKNQSSKKYVQSSNSFDSTIRKLFPIYYNSFKYLELLLRSKQRRFKK